MKKKHSDKATAEKPVVQQTDPLKGWLFWALLAGMLAFAAFIRFYDLKADPPAFFATGSQDLTTDGAYLTLHARQAAEFGEWDLFGYKTWTPFKVSIVSGVSYVLFSLGGVSRVMANATGGILNFGGILLFVIALWNWRSRRFLLLLIFFLCTSFIMTTYARVPFSEDGFLFLAGLAFLVYSRWFDQLWGKVAVGVIIALAGLLGKSFGFLIGIGPLAIIFMGDRKNITRDAAALVSPVAAVFVLFWLTLYRGENFFSFLWEHGAGTHGFPHGLSSPIGFFESLISYGRYGIHTYSPVISVLFYLCVLAILLGKKTKAGLDRHRAFMWSWGIVWVLALSPFNYLPLRYLFVLIMPMAVLAADFLDRLDGLTFGGFGRYVWWKIILLLIVNWMFVYYVGMNFVITNQTTEAYFRAVWLLLPVAILITALMVLTFRQKTLVFSRRSASSVLVLALLMTLVVQGYRHLEWLDKPIRTIAYASGDIPSLIAPEAVIAGQYGPALSFDSRLRNFPLFLTSDSSEVIPYFRTYPITHIAVGESTWQELMKHQPVFRRATVLARYWVRDNIVTLVRVADLFGNQQASRVPLTDFEKSTLAADHGEGDSAAYYLSRFLDAHPDSRAGLANLYYLSLPKGALEAQRRTMDRLTSLYPTDFVVCEMGAIYYKSVLEESHDQRDFTRAEQLLKMSCDLNPVNAESIRQHYASYGPERRIL